MRVVPTGEGESILAVSTEDGRIIFYDLKTTVEDEKADEDSVPQCKAIGQMGGSQVGFTGRIKDFEVLQPKADNALVFVTGSSDGAVRLWKCSTSELTSGSASTTKGSLRQVGTLIGTHETGHRITCLAAFVMDGPAEVADEDSEVQEAAEEESSDSEDE